MGTGRPLPELTLTAEENNRLTEWARRRTTAQALALRARIVLACAQGATNTQVSQRLSVTLQTVGKWRQRFVDQRLDGLLDAPRPGQPRKISDAKVEEVKTRPVSPVDLLGSIYQLAGIDFKAKLPHPMGAEAYVLPHASEGAKSGGLLTEIM